MKISSKSAGICFVSLILTLRMASEPTANVSYLLLAGYAFCGLAQAIQALALLFLFTMLNPGIAAESTLASVGRYVVLVAAASSVLYRCKALIKSTLHTPMVVATFMLGLFFVIHSFIFSPIVDVSVFKALSWTLAMSTLISSWSTLRRNERELLSNQIFGGLILMMLASLPLLASPLGYLRNGTGFQGVLNHPQAFGLTMAMLGAWAASQMFGQKKTSWLMVGLVAACLVFVVLSETRTAGIALFLGVGIALVTAPSLSRRSVRVVLPGLYNKRVHLILVLGLLIALFAGPQLVQNTISEYMDKRVQSASLADSYKLSRGFLMERMLVNIKKEPFWGTGFGIASNPGSMEIQRDPIIGLPVGAAIEKGVMPLAVLEEVGSIGFVAVAIWIWMLLRRSARGGVTPLAVSITALLINMGESTLFSPGGFGLLLLILLAWTSASGQVMDGT